MHVTDWLWLAVIWAALVLSGRWAWPKSGTDLPVIQAQERIAAAEVELYTQEEGEK